jgi:hypothetical protein
MQCNSQFSAFSLYTKRACGSRINDKKATKKPTVRNPPVGVETAAHRYCAGLVQFTPAFLVTDYGQQRGRHIDPREGKVMRVWRPFPIVQCDLSATS